MAKKHDLLLGHGDDNDGIDEYDNPLPDWWMGLFGFCIVYAFGYGTYYHFIHEDSQVRRYQEEIAQAELQWPETEMADSLSYDAPTLAAGQATFVARCVMCHGEDLHGKIGPNLIDSEWLYGNTETAVLTTISEGTPRGMPTWKDSLSSAEIAQVAAYVLSSGSGPGTMERPAEAPPAAVPVAGDTPAPGAAPVEVAPAAVIAPPEGPIVGSEIFAAKCAACHNADLRGLVGPNLIDAEWIHGGTLDDITRTITVGVLDKGMPNWGTMISAEEISAVAQFVQEQGEE